MTDVIIRPPRSTVTEPTRQMTLVARRAEMGRALHGLQFGAGVLVRRRCRHRKDRAGCCGDRPVAVPPLARLVATAAGRSIPFGALSSLLPLDLTAIHPALVVQQLTARLRRATASGRGAARPRGRRRAAARSQSAAALLTLVTTGTVRLLATVRSDLDHRTRSPRCGRNVWSSASTSRRSTGRPPESCSSPSTTAGSASGTVEMLWSRSGGNPLYLTELARYGLERGALVATGRRLVVDRRRRAAASAR